MPLRLRLQRKGSKKKPFYFIVAIDSRKKRDGRFIQKIGTYDPVKTPADIKVDRDSAISWLHKGAQPSTTVRRILSYKGVLLWKHLLRGVDKKLFDMATAESKYAEWAEEHQTKIKDITNKAKIKKESLKHKAVIKEVEVEKKEKVEANAEEMPKVEQKIAETEDQVKEANSKETATEDAKEEPVLEDKKAQDEKPEDIKE